MKTLQAGVIGVGYLGRFHAQKYTGMEHVHLVGVSDLNADNAQAVAAECATTAYTDHEDLLNAGVDAVSIVVPTEAHFEVASACLARGIDVLLEKPITVTLQEADALIALAEKNQCILQIGHLEQFNPAMIAMRPLLTTPIFIESQRLALFNTRGTDVDVVLDLMIHDIEIILSLVNSPIETIHTAGSPVLTPHNDIANARIIFANGCTANITVSRVSVHNKRCMRIFQPGGYLSVDFSRKDVTEFRLTAKNTEEATGDAIYESKTYGDTEQDILELEIRDFLQHVRQRSQPLVSGQQGREALSVALEIVEQIKKNNARFPTLYAE